MRGCKMYDNSNATTIHDKHSRTRTQATHRLTIRRKNQADKVKHRRRKERPANSRTQVDPKGKQCKTKGWKSINQDLPRPRPDVPGDRWRPFEAGTLDVIASVTCQKLWHHGLRRQRPLLVRSVTCQLSDVGIPTFSPKTTTTQSCIFSTRPLNFASRGFQRESISSSTRPRSFVSRGFQRESTSSSWNATVILVTSQSYGLRLFRFQHTKNAHSNIR